VSTSSPVLVALEEAQSTGFARPITGDDSWFHLVYPHESAWAASRDQLPENVSQTIDTQKCLISVLWSIHGIHSLVDVLKATTYNTAFVCDIIVPSTVAEIASHSRRKALKGFMVRLDHAPAHNS
jgi:hypothetical protein